MKKNPLIYYQIGLGLLAVFVVVLFVMVLTQASGTKQDMQTFNRANDISNSLNDYTVSYGRAPDSLAAAKITDVPSTITYQKLTNFSYKFCVTYKANSSNFDPSTVTDNLLTSSNGSNSNTAFSATSNTSLTIDNNHHKGTNCQTIKLGNDSSGGSSTVLPLLTPNVSSPTKSGPTTNSSTTASYTSTTSNTLTTN